MNRYQLGISAGLALLGTLLLALYLQRLENELSGGAPVPVLVARTGIARGEVLAADMLAVREVPSAYVEGRALRASELEHVIGLRLAGSLGAADTLLMSDLAINAGGRGVSGLVQAGKLAYVVSIVRAGASQLIRPGDYVDVFAGMNLLLQRVLVLAVGTNTERDGVAGDDAHLLTFSVTLEQTQLLKKNEPLGISVAVRNADDDDVIIDLLQPKPAPVPQNSIPQPIW